MPSSFEHQNTRSSAMADFFGRREPACSSCAINEKLLDNLKEKYPAVVEELTPNILSLGGIQKVLQNLLAERISVRDLVTILESLADFGTVV